MCLICPFSVKKTGGQRKVQYSDHNTILMNTFLPRWKKSKKKEACQRWRIDNDGLSHFHEITNKTCSVVGRDSYNDFEQYLTKQMNESFKPLPRKREHGNINNNSRYYRHYPSFDEDI